MTACPAVRVQEPTAALTSSTSARGTGAVDVFPPQGECACADGLEPVLTEGLELEGLCVCVCV